jgi:SAM-dependent methyltransferase
VSSPVPHPYVSSGIVARGSAGRPAPAPDGASYGAAVADRGSSYDERFTRLARRGRYLHGEADLIDAVAGGPPGTVVDAGCGTGRVAVELARRGYTVTGVDVDPEMLGAARAKAPELDWRQADLAAGVPDLGPVDLVVAAGNVMIFVAPGTEADVVRTLAGFLGPDGLLVTGFQLLPRLPIARLDELCEAAGLVLQDRWATWEQAPFVGGDYAVSLHRRRRARSPGR